MAVNSPDTIAPTDATETTILVVDDNPELADLHTTVLEETYQTKTAYSGEEALEQIDDTIDIVLLDRKMPRISGDEVLAEIRRRGFDCRVIMVTAVKPDFDIIKLGFDGYAIKPVKPSDLRDRVDQVYARTAYETSLQEYYSLAEKKSVLEATKSESALLASEEYETLKARLADARTAVEEVLTEFDTERFKEAIERTRSLSALREREQRYRSLTEDVLDTSRVGTVILDQQGTVVWVNAAIVRFFGIDRSVLLDQNYRAVIRQQFRSVFADGETTVDRLTDIHTENESVAEFECRVVAGDNRVDRWLKHWSKPIETGLYAGGRIEHYYDITPLKERELTLETLHDTSLELVNAQSRDDTIRIAVETAESLLGFSLVAFYEWDESSGELVPLVSNSAMQPHQNDLVTIDNEDRLLWDAFVEGEPQNGTRQNGNFGSELAVPIGNHGVLLLCDENPNAFSEPDVSFATALAANTEVVLDRAARERTVRQRDEQLQQRNEQLNRLNRINRIIRGIGRALVSAPSRSAIEQAVCARLVDIASYEFVWIGEQDVINDELTLRTAAGDEGGYFADVLGQSAHHDGTNDSAVRALETGEVQTISNILEDTARGTKRVEALKQGYQSLVSVPITYKETVYGVFEVYADRPYAFDDEERAVLAELGDTIGHAINAVKRKEALLTTTSIEAEFEVTDDNDFFVRLANHLDTEIELKSVVPAPDDSTLVFYAVTDPAEDRIHELTNDSFMGVDTAVVREQTGRIILKSRVDASTVITEFAERGAVPRSVIANKNGCRVIATFPESIDLRSFSEALNAIHPTTLLARRESVSDQNESMLRDQIDGDLTDRQREALQAAYFAGYFDWPRENPGETVADTLDISQPTFQQHLRAGERKLLAALFSE